MLIIRAPNTCFIRAGCVVCGVAFELDDPAYNAYDGDDAHVGCVCPECAELDNARIREVLHQQAEDLRQHALELEELATQPIARLEGHRHFDMARRRSMRLPRDDDGDLPY
jgi:hypothetical protein